jgi:hypothetical protein
MLKKLIHSRLDALEKDLGYDVGYVREILDVDLSAFLRLMRLSGISSYRRDVPPEVAYAVKLVGTLQEDCGPCTQLMVTMAQREAVPDAILRAVVSGDDAALPPDVLLAVQFARASLTRDAQADELRERIVTRFGHRGLVTVAFGLVAARVYPTLKYALGYGRSCSRVQIGEKTLAPKQPRPAVLGATA